MFDCGTIDWTQVSFERAGTPRTRPQTRIRDVIDVVCAYFSISIIDLCGPSRKRPFVIPRHAAMYLARELTGKSFPQIARSFSDKDHTVILWAHRKIGKLAAEDPAFAASLDAMRERIVALVQERAS